MFSDRTGCFIKMDVGDTCMTLINRSSQMGEIKFTFPFRSDSVGMAVDSIIAANTRVTSAVSVIVPTSFLSSSSHTLYPFICSKMRVVYRDCLDRTASRARSGAWQTRIGL